MFIQWLQQLMRHPVSFAFANGAGPFPLPAERSRTGAATPALAVVPPAPRLTDVTARLRPARLLFGRKAHTLLEVWVLRNTRDTPIEGPLHVVLDDLGGQVRLLNASGRALNHGRPGAPYVRLNTGRIAPGQAVAVDLVFAARKDAAVQFTFSVLAGNGVV